MNAEELSKIISKKLDNNSSELTEQFHATQNSTTTKFFILDNFLPKNLLVNFKKPIFNKKLLIKIK